jgi:uncharacterized protein involved in response to NO
MKQNHTPIPRYRSFTGPAVFSQGFRPFFLLAGIWAAAALALSFGMFQGWIALPTAFGVVEWHYHEMLFGYVAAAIAGFLLTAIPNWTGGLPLQGAPLIGLVALWIAGRVAVMGSDWIGAGAAAVIDLGFLVVLGGVTVRQIVSGRNWRNLPPVLAIALLLVFNALSHAAALGLVDADGVARRGGIAVVVMLIALIGGRVIPSFTRNWLVKRQAEALPASFDGFDRVALATTLLALGIWAVAPDNNVAAALAAVAAAVNLARLMRWQGIATRPEPLLWVLHLGYLWIPVGLALLAASQWWPSIPSGAAVHALTAGGFGTMTLAVMSRATLGHTGRALTAGPGLTAAFVLVTCAALARVLASLFDAAYQPLLTIAAAGWIAAFLCYLTVCGPMFLAARPRT